MRLPDANEFFVDKYQLDAVLGEGGFARVFRATELTLSRPVALKVLKHGDDGDYPPGTKARFNREVRVIANLTDTHTVTLYDWGETDDGLLYLVFEYIEGRDVVDILRESGPIEEVFTVRVLEQVLHSLREAHRNALLHRDIKPHNIRIYEYDGDPWCAKLLDFGIAKPVRREGAEITAEGVIVGSPRYMSPEQLFEREMDGRSDLYSLGLVAIEMLLGRRALKSSRLNDQLPRLTGAEVPSIPDDAPVSPRMREIIARLLQYSPAERFASADEVLAALAATRTRPLAPPVPPPTNTITVAEQVRPTPPRTTEPEKRQPRAAKIGVAALVAVAIVATAAALLILRRPAPTPTPARVVLPTTANSDPPQPDSPGEPPVVVPDAAAATGAVVAFGGGCGVDPPFRGRGALTGLLGLQRYSWAAYIPTNYDPDTRHQVVMLFHEDVDNPGITLDITKFDTYAEARSMVILMPHDPAMRAWRGMPGVEMAHAIFEISAEKLCLKDDGVLTFGHGTGGRAVERLHCVMPVKAAATSSHRPEADDVFCEPVAPEPFLLVAPLSDGYDPIEGGSPCGAAKISLDEFESRWRQRNHCGGTSKRERRDGATCFSWACQTEFVSCHARGGHRWPQQPPRAADFQDCDGGEMKLPIADIVWEFFDRYAN